MCSSDLGPAPSLASYCPNRCGAYRSCVCAHDSRLLVCAPIDATPERISGGSSSGSAAAVSNRLADIALGTDTGGSVRAPASHCGLYGIRPTHGRVSLRGCMDLSPSLDTCGWFARDAQTFARAADVLAGADAQPLPAKLRLLEIGRAHV